MKKEILIEIARHYGTPVYVYDLEKVKNRFKDLEKIFSKLNPEIHYAVKANHNPLIIKTLYAEGAKYDTVSLEEVRHLLDLGVKEEDILYTPSCPSEKELNQALNTNITVHIGEAEHLEWVAEKFKNRPVGIRINPDLNIGGNQKIATAHAFSKFGIPWSYKERILKLVRENRLKITGLHVHLGSDIQVEETLKKNVDFLTEISRLFPDLSYLDFGGGFKVAYRPGDTETDLESFSAYIFDKQKNSPVKWRVKIEPGKYLVAEAGLLLTEVSLVKETPAKKFICLNSGFNHFIRPMYYNAYHPVENITSNEAVKEKYDVVGYLCEEDTFARDRELPRTQKGDLIAIKYAGAYGMVMSSRYNLRPLPKEIVVEGEKITEV